MRKGSGPVDWDDLVRTVRDQAGPSELDRLATAVGHAETLRSMGDELVGLFVEEARGSGCSWAQIGARLGVSKQAVQQRHRGRPRLFRARRPAQGEGGLERFTEEGRRVVVHAQEEARRFGHNYVGTEHLLVGLLLERRSPAGKALRSLRVTAREVRSRIEGEIGLGAGAVAEVIPMTPRTKKVLQLARRQSERLGSAGVGPEHVLLGIVEEGQGVAAQVLAGLGASPSRLREALAEAM